MIKFCYIRDQGNQARVLTLAYQITPTGVTYAYAINKPSSKRRDNLRELLTGDGSLLHTGDQFVRKIGRNIASGRLSGGKSRSITCAPGKHIAAILADLSNDPKASPANRVASEILANHNLPGQKC